MVFKEELITLFIIYSLLKMTQVFLQMFIVTHDHPAEIEAKEYKYLVPVAFLANIGLGVLLNYFCVKKRKELLFGEIMNTVVMLLWVIYCIGFYEVSISSEKHEEQSLVEESIPENNLYHKNNFPVNRYPKQLSWGSLFCLSASSAAVQIILHFLSCRLYRKYKDYQSEAELPSPGNENIPIPTIDNPPTYSDVIDVETPPPEFDDIQQNEFPSSSSTQGSQLFTRNESPSPSPSNLQSTPPPKYEDSPASSSRRASSPLHSPSSSVDQELQEHSPRPPLATSESNPKHRYNLRST